MASIIYKKLKKKQTFTTLSFQIDQRLMLAFPMDQSGICSAYCCQVLADTFEMDISV